MSRLNAIDLMRLIAAFSIMFLHTSLGAISVNNQEIIRLSVRWAVPFFFITSGFFLGKKLDKQNISNFDLIGKNLIKFFSIFLISNILYLPIEYFKNFEILKIENLFIGVFSHLWFIGSLIYGYLSIWYFYYIKKTSILPYLSMLIIVLSLLANGYISYWGGAIKYEIFRYLLSIPFIYIGIRISKLRLTFLSKHKYLLFILILLGFIFQNIESRELYLRFKTNRFDQEFLIGTFIISISLFLFVLNLRLKDNLISKYGREYSLFIYIYHPLIYVIMSFFTYKLFFNNINYLLQFFPLIGFILTLMLGVFLNKYFNRVFKILNGIF